MKSAWAGLAVLVLGVGLILAAGTPRGEKQIQDWLIGWPERPEGQSASLTVYQRLDGALLADFGDGGRELDMPKTQVYDGIGHLSGNLIMVYGGRTHHTTIDAGGISCVLEDITEVGWDGPNPQPEGGHAHTVAAYVESEWGDEDHTFHYYEAPGWYLSYAYDYSISGRRLEREETTTEGAGRDNKPVYAREVHEADHWDPVFPISWAVTFNGLGLSGTQTWDDEEGEWLPQAIIPIVGMTWSFWQSQVTAGQEYLRWTLNWDGVATDFSGREHDAGTGMVVIGDGNAVYLYGEGTTEVDLQHSVTHGQPVIVDFSEFLVTDRLAAFVPDLRISGPFVASAHYPPSLGWSTTP